MDLSVKSIKPWEGKSIKKHIYSLIGLGIIIGPLALSFDQKVFFIGNILPVLVATVVVGAIYIAWDAWVVRLGDWKFNPEWTGMWRLFDLPAGEWLFFLSVPYASLFLFEVFGAYFGRAMVSIVPRWMSFVLAGVFMSLAYAFRKKHYTFLAMFSVAVFMVLQGLLVPDFWKRQDILLTMGSSVGTFLLVNGIYTRLPTIHYNPNAIWGVRVGTIPLEDFFYNLGMLGFYLLVYWLAKWGVQPWV